MAASIKTLTLKGLVNPDCSGLTFMSRTLANMKLAGKANSEVDVTLVFGRVPRTLAQNRYLWGVVYPTIQQGLLEITGEYFSPEELHAYNLQRIQGNSVEIKQVDGQEFIVIKDKKSSEMSVDEFVIMVDNVIKYCAEKWGIVIPPPVGDNSLDEIFKI